MQKFLRTLMLMALMIVPFASHAQVIVEIGESTSTTTQYTVPVNMYYNYSLTQQIFTADEIGVAGTINSIAFEYTNTSSFSMDSVRVYMKNVTKTEFATTTDMEAIASTDLVWEGTLSAADAGWVTLTLTTPFVYDGTSNLLVCCYDNQSGYPGSAFKFRTTTTGSAYRGIAYYSDSSIPSIDDVTTFSGSKTRYTYRNNIQLGITPSGNYCEKPSTFEVSSITSDGATFTWATTSASSYQFEYKTSADTVWTEVTLTGNTYTLTTLSANTEYDVRVKAICGADSESGYKSASFRTACAAIATLPYTMGFEASEILATTPNADALPFCWSRYASGTGSYTYYPYSYSSTTYAHGGSSRVLYFYDGTSASYPDTMVAILPEVDVTTYPMNSNRLTFWGRVSTGTNVKNVQIGTMTDPTDMSTFALVETVAVSGTTHTLYSVPLTNASATAPYVAIMLVKSASGYLCIDDVTLEEMPSCLEISNLAAGNITSSSVELTWADAANASATYTVYNMADTSVVATGVAGTTYTVTDLDANTQYTFGVAANCPAGDASIMTVSARTACAEETMPWSENFDDWTTKSPCWSFLSGAYNMGAGTPTTTTSGWALQTTYGSYITISGKALGFNLYSTYRYWAVTPGIIITSNDVMLSVDVAVSAWSAATPNYDADDTLAFAISTDGGSTFTNLMVLDNAQLNALSGNYTTINVPVAGYMGQTVRFAIFGGSSASGGDNRIVIDNVTVGEAPSCMTPQGLNIAYDGGTTATVSWTSDANAANISVNGVVTNNVTSPYTLTGLNLATTYNVMVQADCGDATSDWTAAVSFTTDFCVTENQCQITLALTDSYGDSWNGNAIVVTDSLSGVALGQFANQSASAGVAELYTIGVCSGRTLQFSWVSGSYPGEASFEIINGGNTTVFTGSGSSMTGGQVFFTMSEPCPSCIAPAALAASNITTDGAMLTWTGDAASYNVYVLEATGTATLLQNVTTTTITLTGLTANTQYTYGVATVCGAEESSMVTVTFRTPCTAVDVPYTETFESTSATRDCWNLVATGNIGGTNGMGFVTVNGRETLRFSSYSSASDYNQYGFSPVMNNTTTDSLHVKVVYATYGSSDVLNFGYIAGADTVWALADFHTTGSSDFQTFEANLPANTTQLAVHYYGNFSYYAWIDSVEVTVATAGGDTTVVPDSVHITYAVNDATMGTTNPAPGTYAYVGNEAFSVTAVPATGYHLVDWQFTLNIPGYGPYTEMMETDAITISDTAYAEYEGLVLTAIFAADGGDTTVVECDPVTIPFVETFETTSATRDCWTLVSNNESNVGGSTGMGFLTVNNREVLQFSSYSGASDYNQYGYSPLLSPSADATALQVSVVYGTRSSDYLYFGYISGNDTVWDPTAYNTAGTSSNPNWQTYTAIIPVTATKLAVHYYGDYAYYAWIDSVVVNELTAAYCYAVTGLTADSVTPTSVHLTWTDANNSGATYTVYNMADTSVVATGIATTSYEVTGLTALTGYTFGVVTNCTATDASDIVTINLVTACGGETCNIEINGADSYGDGWNGNAIQVMQAGNVIATFTIATGNSASAQIPVCSGYPVSFAWVSGSYPGETSFEIKDGGGMVVYTESGSNLTGGEVFYTMANACPSCIPAMITVDNITETSVTINWTGTAASYDVYNGNTLVTNTSANTYTFTGLTPATTYTFGVQAICSATDTAAMNTVTVATACADITTLPYMEGFEAGLGCWTTVNGSADGMPWYALNEASYAHTGTGFAASFSYYNYSSMHADAWLISPKFVLPTVNAGDTLNFSWWYQVDAGYPLDLYDVMLSTTTDDTAAFTTTLLAVTPDSNNGEYTQMLVDLTAYAGQSIYLAFHHHDSYDQDFLMIDDIFMGVGAAPVPEPDTLTVTFAVNDATMGTTVPAPGTYQYLSGDTLSFTAVPNTGYIFKGWTVVYGDGSVDSLGASYISATALADVFMNFSPMTITALFGTVDPNSDSMQVNVAVNDPTMGTTIPAPGTHYFHVGESASVVAVPNDGYYLTGWTVNVVSQGMTLVDTTYNYAFDDVFSLFGGWIVDEGDDTYVWSVTANFAAGEPPVMHDSVTVNVSVNNETMGVVTPAPGTHYYVLGDTAIISIMPNPGYRVVAVQMSATHPIMGTLYDETITDSLELAALVGMNDTLIVDDEDMYGLVLNINVIFAAEGAEPTTYTVEVAYDQTKGTVTGAGDYVEGSNVRLVAMPATHYEFYAWLDNNTGDTVSRETVYAIANIDRDYFLTAIFVASTGIDDVDMDNVTIYSTDNVIVVRGAEGKQVVLFDVNGRMLSREARAAEQVEFRVNNSGVYLVKVADAAAKRVVVIR